MATEGELTHQELREPAAHPPIEPAAPQPTEPAGRQPERAKLPFPLQGNEQVLVIARRHWWYLWPRMFLWTVLGLAPPIILAWLFFDVASLSGTLAQIFWAVAAIYVLFWAVRLLLNWYQYHNDMWVITNQRIVDVIKPTPIGLKISSADLVNIQDMTVQRRGIFATALKFGDVVCQTAADNRDFVMTGVPHPQELQLLIDKERDRERMRARGG